MTIEDGANMGFYLGKLLHTLSGLLLALEKRSEKTLK